MSPADLDRLVAERNYAGECGCGCGHQIPDVKAGKQRRVKFLPDHRQRMYKRRVQAAAVERGLEPRLSLRSLQAPTGTEDRSGYAADGASVREEGKPARSKPSGAQVSYRKAVGAATEMLVQMGHTPPQAERTAERYMAGVLPEKQRARMHATDG